MKPGEGPEFVSSESGENGDDNAPLARLGTSNKAGSMRRRSGTACGRGMHQRGSQWRGWRGST